VKHKDYIRPDGGEPVANVFVESAADRRYSDHNSDSDHDAEHGQARPQLVRADRFSCHLKDFAELTLTHDEIESLH
jgi:hypothetical protein